MTPAALLAGMEATWPPAARHDLGPFRLRQGLGGGKRVSAASVTGRWSTDDLDRALAAMDAMGQSRLFQLQGDADADLDAELHRRGFRLIDPVIGYAAPLSHLSEPEPPPLTAFAHWPPLQIAQDIWAEAGIGPARLAVMHRVTGPKAAVLSRTNDRVTGTAFVALAGTVAFLHALEISPASRRQGAAQGILRVAARWAADQGAHDLALVVTTANTPARRLYEGLGMQALAGYHYREWPDDLDRT
jgi:GNAT superfamily N-acetyltransferase